MCESAYLYDGLSVHRRQYSVEFTCRETVAAAAGATAGETAVQRSAEWRAWGTNSVRTVVLFTK